MKTALQLMLLLAALPRVVDARDNVVLIFIDNVGYGDLGCYGNKVVQTPHIDQLAREGVRCTDFYIASPSCMPSRAALLTGRHPLRNGLNQQLWKTPSQEQIGLKHDEKLIPQYLKPQGYKSACFGKWNIGFAEGSRPLDRGFDRYFGNISGNCDYYTHIYTGRHDWYEGNESKKVEGYATYLLADEASRFIRDNREWPFFLYLPFNAAHFPNRKNKAPGEPVIWQAPDGAFEALGYSPDTQDETQRYHAVLWALDEGIGRVLKSIGESGVRDKTLVMLISDNGAFMLTGRGLECASNKPLRSGGVTTWEGGIRVPAIFRWPDKLEAGTECRDALWSLDVLPLILRAAGAKMPSDRVFDGKDPLSTLQGHSGSPHELLCWRYGKYSGLRQGDWKLVQEKPGAEWQLFNLKSDLGETANLASSQPDIHRRLVRRFEDWLARMPYQE